MGFHRGPKIITDGLVLHLDAANPRSYPGSGTTWYDLSGNNNHATLIGNPDYVTWDSSGYFFHNPGNYFGAPDSTTASSEDFGAYWNILSDSSLDPSNGWTVSGYVNILGPQSGNGVGWFVQDNNNGRVHIEPITSNFRVNGASGYNGIYENITNWHNVITYFSVTFYQVSGIYGTDPGELKLYINGSFTDSNSNFIPTASPDFQISLGRRRGHLSHFLKGNIVDYKFFNRPLIEQEIQQNYNATKRRFL